MADRAVEQTSYPRRVLFEPSQVDERATPEVGVPPDNGSRDDVVIDLRGEEAVIETATEHLPHDGSGGGLVRPSEVGAPGPGTVDATQDDVVIDLRGDEAVIETARSRVLLEGDEGILGAPNALLAIKRVVDIAASAFFLIMLTPIFLIAAIAVKLSSPGPLLFVQDRVGKDGKAFRFAKFRSMRNGAHTELDDLQHLNDVAGPVFKMREDPRITSVGRFMRKYSIDELPQLFHVLTGKMSLVGPRPPIPAEVTTYDEWQRQRLMAKPGITCIWQVSGRSDLDFETWVEMDVEYIRTWKPWLDFLILLKTLPAVISGKGAY